MKQSPTLLFIGHDASRSGAPLILLGLLRWLHEHTDWKLKLLLLKHGVLENDYRKYADVKLYPDIIGGNDSWLSRVRKRLGMRPTSPSDCLARYFKVGEIDLIDANTVASGALLSDLVYLRAPTVLHVHESAIGLSKYGGQRWPQIALHVSQYMGCSVTTAECLTKHYHVKADMIDIVPEPLLAISECGAPPLLPDAAVVREQLGIPHNHIVLGGCGTQYWRKGMDLFAQVCALSQRKSSAMFHFVWVGGSANDVDHMRFAYDMAKRGLSDRFHHIPNCADPLKYMRIMDIFCMTSRDEAFGMVNAEAAYLKKPVVYFEDVGGPTEIIGNEAGIGAPYGDVEAMAEAVVRLVQDDRLRLQYGEAGHRRVMQYYSPGQVFPKMQDVLARVMSL